MPIIILDRRLALLPTGDTCVHLFCSLSSSTPPTAVKRLVGYITLAQDIVDDKDNPTESTRVINALLAV